MPRNQVVVFVTGDTKDLQRNLTDAEKRLERFGTTADKAGDRMARAGRKMTVFATAPIVAGLGLATKAASDLEQSVGAVESIFGRAKGPIEEFGQTAADTAGLSKREVNEMAAILGASLQGLGFEAGESATRVVALQKRGADLAATFGGTTRQALDAVASVMRGERDPIERYGVSIKQVDINARVAAMGLDTSTAASKKNSEAIAGLDLLMEQTAKTQGTFAREQDTTAGATARARAEIENAAASLGENLLPLAASAADKVAALAEQFGNLPQPVQTAILALGGLVAVTGPILTVVGNVKKLREGIVALNSANAALAGKLGGVGVALGLAATAAYLFARKKDDAKRTVEEFTDAIEADSGALGDNTRAVVANRLEKDGLLQQARELGISTSRVVDAVMGDAEAMEELQAKTAAARREMDSFNEETSAADLITGRQEIEDFGEEIQALAGSMDAAEESTKREAEALGETGDAAGDAAGGFDEVSESAERATRKVETFGEKVADAVDRTFALGDAQRSVDELFGDLSDTATEKAERRADAEERVADAIESSERRIRDARQGLADAEEDFQKIASGDRTQARRRVRDAKQDIADAERDGAEAIDEAKESQEDANAAAETQRDLVHDIGRGVADVVAEMVKQGATASEINGYIETQRQRLVGVAAQLGINRGEVEKILSLWTAITNLTWKPRDFGSADTLERRAGRASSHRVVGSADSLERGGITLNVITADEPSAIARAIARELSLYGGRG